MQRAYVHIFVQFNKRATKSIASVRYQRDWINRTAGFSRSDFHLVKLAASDTELLRMFDARSLPAQSLRCLLAAARVSASVVMILLQFC